MKKLQRTNLDRMSLELKHMVPAEQRRCLGGTGNCQHGVSPDDMCYQCGGHKPATWEEFVALSEAGTWPGGYYISAGGTACYSPPSSTEGVVTGHAVPTGFCPEHGTYDGTECIFAHTGVGDQYCEEHLKFYTETCSDCSGIVTGYCGDHNRSYPDNGDCPVCSDDSGEGGNDGDGGNNNTDAEVGNNICPLHGAYWGNSCSACYTENLSQTGQGYNIDSVVVCYTDATFSNEKLQNLRDALDTICCDKVGKYIYDQIFSASGDPVRFTIGETSTFIVDGEMEYARAQYQNGVITYHPDTDIAYTNLGEELVHAFQHDVYGNAMTNKDLNYEFEAKLMNYIIRGDGMVSASMGYSTDQGIAFDEFTDKIKSGDYTWEELKPDYQKHFSNWSASGYENKPGVSKPMNFDSRLIEQIIEFSKK